MKSNDDVTTTCDLCGNEADPAQFSFTQRRLETLCMRCALVRASQAERARWEEADNMDDTPAEKCAREAAVWNETQRAWRERFKTRMAK